MQGFYPKHEGKSGEGRRLKWGDTCLRCGAELESLVL